MMLFRPVKTISFTPILMHMTLIVILMTSACTNIQRPEGMPLAEMTFAHLEAVPIKAANIEKKIGFSVTSPAVGYFRPSPDIILQRYLDERFVPSQDSSTGTLYINIPEISLQEKSTQSEASRNPLEIKTTILHMLLKVELEYQFGQSGYKRTSLQARRTKALRENMTIAQREAAAQDLIKNLITDLDPKLIERIQLITSDLPSSE